MAPGKVIHNFEAGAAGGDPASDFAAARLAAKGAALALYARRRQSVPKENALEAFSGPVTPGPRPRGT